MDGFTLLLRLLLLLFTSLLFAKNDSYDLKEIHVQLNWKHQFEHAGFYAAINEGYYEKIGLKIILHEKNNKSNIYGDVVALKMDFAIGYSSIVLEYLEGKPLVALASLFQHSPLVFLSKSSSKIRTVSDMREKNVMVNIASRSAASLLIMIKKEGLSFSDMNIQKHNLASPYSYRLLQEKQYHSLYRPKNNIPILCHQYRATKYFMLSKLSDHFMVRVLRIISVRFNNECL